MNLYSILGLPHGSSIREVKKAYKKLMLIYHPDKNNGKTDNKYYSIMMAYNVLSDLNKKKNYDNTGYINDYDYVGEKQTGFFDMINSVFDTIFGKSMDIFSELKHDKILNEMIKQGKNEEAKNYLSELFYSQSVQSNVDSDQSIVSNTSYKNSDIILNITTNINEVIKGMIKVITFNRQCFKNNVIVNETSTLSVPVCDDRVVYENMGHDFINNNGKLERGRVIVNIKCDHNSKIKRVNSYDIMIVSKINDFELEHGYKKKFKIANNYVNIICNNPQDKMINDKITIKVDNKGIKYYEECDIEKIKYGDLYIVLFKN